MGILNQKLISYLLSTITIKLRTNEDLDETLQTSSSLRLIKYYFALNSRRIEPFNRPVSRVNKWFKFALRHLGGTTSSFSHAQRDPKVKRIIFWRVDARRNSASAVYIPTGCICNAA